MQVVILSAGQSSRFYPLSNGIHKSMIKICGKPLLEHTILGLKKLGLTDIILIIDSKEYIKSYFGDGKKLGVSITYVNQPEPLGAGNAILLAEKYIKGDFLLLNGYHVDVEDLAKELIDKKTDEEKARLLIKQKEVTKNSGVVKIENGRLIDLIEKPKKEEEFSKFCVVGLYLFSKEFLGELHNTPPEHYQLEKAISSFAKNNYISVCETKKDVLTLKYPWDLFSIKDYILKTIKKSISKTAIIAKSAEIIGNVIIEDGVNIMEGVKIKGPCYLGKDVTIGNNAILRNGVDVEKDSVVGANMEIKNTIVMSGVKTHSGFVGDSIIGEGSRVAAQFCTANVRLDRNPVEVNINGSKMSTGLKCLGMIVGKNVHIGIKSSTMPGIIIGNNVVVGPSTTVLNNIGDNTKYYSKFQEIIAKNE